MTSHTLCRAPLCSIRMTLLPRLPYAIRSFEEKVVVVVVVKKGRIFFVKKRVPAPKTLRNFSD